MADMPALGLDPSSNFNLTVQTLQNVYETLLRYDAEKDEFTYLAAESYETSEDGLTWTFHIRPNMTLHDGTPVDAAAVKYSFERTINMGLGAAFIWEPVENFEVKDASTLLMHLKHPDPMDLI